MRIPRLFHQIWLGRQPMPAEFLRWQQTWTSLNPGWELKLWTEDNLLPTQWPDLILKAHGYAHISDIYRYEILLREGGIYMDTDFECLRPIEPLLSDCEAFVVLKNCYPAIINSAISGGVPGHLLFRQLVEDMGLANMEDKHSLGSPYLTSHVEKLTSLDARRTLKILPASLMNPSAYEFHEKGRWSRKDFPKAYCLHHWSSQWLPLGFAKLDPSAKAAMP